MIRSALAVGRKELRQIVRDALAHAAAHGATAADLSVAFVSGAAAEEGNDHMTTRRRRVGVRGTRGIGPADLVMNDRLGSVTVTPDGVVSLDGEVVETPRGAYVRIERPAPTLPVDRAAERLATL